MRFGRKNVVIKTHEGPKIISMPHTTKHSHEAAVCPPGFSPGDEAFLSVSKNGQIIFDLAGHRSNKSEKAKNEQKKNDWNESTPIERFKDKLKPREKK